jgi:hypothetical protein
VTEAALCQASEPPLTPGAVGAVRSIRIVFVAPDAAGFQAERFPAPSTVRSCTSVCPSAATVSEAPAAAADHVVPPSVEALYS